MFDNVEFAWTIALGLVLAALLLYLGWLGLRALRRWDERRQHVRECARKESQHLGELGRELSKLRVEVGLEEDVGTCRLNFSGARLGPTHLARIKALEDAVKMLRETMDARSQAGQEYMQRMGERYSNISAKVHELVGLRAAEHSAIKAELDKIRVRLEVVEKRTEPVLSVSQGIAGVPVELRKGRRQPRSVKTR